MFIRDLNSCEEFIAGDNSVLRELIHPDKADLNLRYSLAHATIAPGQMTVWHKLKTSELYYILEGTGRMYIEQEEKDVFPNQAIYIPPLSTQRIKNTGTKPLKFICIVDPAWRKQDEEILKS
jgi:mannose-6-phosphate isomerase-like protein (cupin superfamily)